MIWIDLVIQHWRTACHGGLCFKQHVGAHVSHEMYGFQDMARLQEKGDAAEAELRALEMDLTGKVGVVFNAAHRSPHKGLLIHV